MHGHSSHHVKGAELYKGKLIIYGAGDLINDYEGLPVSCSWIWRGKRGRLRWPSIRPGAPAQGRPAPASARPANFLPACSSRGLLPAPLKPPESTDGSPPLRKDLGLLWYADVRPSDGTLQSLTLRPTRLK